jgi:hypothetical protein
MHSQCQFHEPFPFCLQYTRNGFKLEGTRGRKRKLRQHHIFAILLPSHGILSKVTAQRGSGELAQEGKLHQGLPGMPTGWKRCVVQRIQGL